MQSIINFILGALVSWKTSIAGVVAAVVMILSTLHIITIPTEIQNSIVAVIVFFAGLAAKDANKSGKPQDD